MLVRCALPLALACCFIRPAVAQSAPPAKAAPVPAPAAQAPPREESLPTSWSDPRVLAELQKGCHFDPDSLPEAQRSKWLGERGPGESSPLSCEAEFDQSCVYDPCFDSAERSCKPRCTSACKQCGQDCATSCESCRERCNDEACTAACARSCATCREGCVRQRDRCATGTCTEAYKACRTKLRSDWRKNECGQVCRSYVSCERRCLARRKGDNEDAFSLCAKPCRKSIKSRGCDLSLCQGSQFSMGIDPEARD